ncbi:hypothetical protein [Flavisphingomonas formosensis]|uniref:hypothetical protein n=1 Tax=Flavisphingomonas formosensis TaxID=861534 RepID=UPI0012FCF718|nr:hypothetical protein [Sphingomonas formosensis]
MSEAKQTTDHATIRKWVEARGGRPAVIRTKGGDGGVLRIDYGSPEDNLVEIAWEEFFRIFDRSKIAFLYQEKTSDGQESRFSKFIDR